MPNIHKMYLYGSVDFFSFTTELYTLQYSSNTYIFRHSHIKLFRYHVYFHALKYTYSQVQEMLISTKKTCTSIQIKMFSHTIPIVLLFLLSNFTQANRLAHVIFIEQHRCLCEHNLVDKNREKDYFRSNLLLVFLTQYSIVISKENKFSMPVSNNSLINKMIQSRSRIIKEH